MKDGIGEMLTSLEDSPQFTVLPGSRPVLPEPDSVSFGMASGERKTVFVSREQGLTGLNDDFYFDVVIDNVREASEEEIMQGQPFMEIPADECGSDCSCRCQNLR